jgi:anaerobic selenocysteine-containing dehydrogenase
MTIRYVKGCCPLDCQDTCSWVAEVQDGKVIKVSGAKDHPFTRGVLCAKVNDYEAKTYSPDRILYPLRRIGPKGNGDFERITWSEAIISIAQKFSEIIEEDGAEALLPHHYLGSLGVVQKRSLMRIFNALGATRQIGSLCGQAGNVVFGEGFPQGFDPEDMAESKLILLWGANDQSTSHHHFHFMNQARKNHGAKLICIDPRKTRTARASDQHIAIRPGSDSALAAGIANLLLEEGLADLSFAREVATDVDDYIQMVSEWPVERVAQACGIDVKVIVQLAQEFGKAQPAVIRSGIGPQQSVHGESFVRNISALAILGGHWQLKGGGCFIETYPVFHDGLAERPDLLSDNPRSLDMAKLGRTLNDKSLKPPIKGLMIWGTNPAVVQTNVTEVRKGLARDELFTVVLEHFLTDTAKYADIVLPATTQLEHFDIQGAWGHHYISLNNPAIAPLGESKSHGEVMRLLARELRLDHPAFQESDEEIAASALPQDVSLEHLKKEDWIKTTPEKAIFGIDGQKVRLAVSVPEPVS